MILKLYLRLRSTKYRLFLISPQTNTAKTFFELISQAKKDFEYLEDTDIIIAGTTSIEFLKGYSYIYFDLNLIKEKKLDNYFGLSSNGDDNFVL